MTRPATTPTPRAVLRADFHAKDENRLQVMRQAFAPDATPPDARRVSRDWLVAMSDTESRCARMGCGS
jgi:hypothetical protein